MNYNALMIKYYMPLLCLNINLIMGMWKKRKEKVIETGVKFLIFNLKKKILWKKTLINYIALMLKYYMPLLCLNINLILCVLNKRKEKVIETGIKFRVKIMKILPVKKNNNLVEKKFNKLYCSYGKVSYALIMS